MLLGVKTQSGSLYVLDLANDKWERRVVGATAGSIRSESGNIIMVMDLEVGRPMVVAVEPLEGAPEGTIRVITTSVVESIVASCPSCGDESCNID